MPTNFTMVIKFKQAKSVNVQSQDYKLFEHSLLRSVTGRFLSLFQEPIDTKLKKSKSSLTKTKQCAHSDCKLKSRIENHPDTVSSKKCKCRSKNPASDNGSFGWWPVSLELNSLLMQSALCIIITLIFLYLLDYIIYLILFIYFCSKIIRQQKALQMFTRIRNYI